jgi:hypothetical protein
MIKLRYICLALAATFIVSLSSCNQQAANNSTPNPAPTSQAQVQQDASHMHGGKKININSAILSELDKLEAKLGIPALSNKIQAARPYASPEELVSKKVITQEQFDQVKEMVTIEEIKLTGEAKDVDYMVKLGLMKGHLYVAKELLDQQKPKDAEPHIGHPVEEIYVDVEEQLNERKVPEFKTTLTKLQDLVKASGKADAIKTEFETSIKAVDSAIAALPADQRSKTSFVLQVINGLLDTANSEYGAAIADGKVSAAIEYQDSRGFVVYARELYKTISADMTKANGQVHKSIETNMTELAKAWPAVVPPAKPVKTTDEVTKLVKTIEKDTQTVASASAK